MLQSAVPCAQVEKSGMRIDRICRQGGDMEIGMEHIDFAVMARRDCAVILGVLAPTAENVPAFFLYDRGERGA